MRPSGSSIAGVDAAARLAVHRVLDLHDLGAEPGEQLRRVRQRLHLLGREDAHAVERLAVLRARRRWRCLRAAPGVTVRAAPSGPTPRTRASGRCRARHVRLQPCEGSSVAGGLRARTGASTAPRSRRPSGQGGGKGTRSVASYDEDTTTMGVEAARLALRRRPTARARRAAGSPPRIPAYARQDQRHRRSTPRCGSTPTCRRSTSAARCARPSARSRSRSTGSGAALVVAVRHAHRPARQRRRSRRAATPRPRSSSAPTPTARSSPSTSARRSATEEFLDRWRTPGDRRSKVWEERFGEIKYVPLGEQAWNAALKDAGLAADQVDRAHRHRHCTPRAVRGVGAPARRRRRRASPTTSRRPSATPAPRSRRCCSPPRSSRPRPARSSRSSCSPTAPTCCCSAPPTRSRRYRPARPVADADRRRRRRCPTASSSSWRGMVTVEPPRRPEPAAGLGVGRGAAPRTGSSAFVGSRDRATGALHLPPARVSRVGGARRRHGAGADGRRRRARSSRSRSTASRTRRARRSCSRSSTSTAAAGSRSSSPTSTPTTSQIGDRVEMTFRRLFTADGIHNYFWKARPVRG